jgi:NAD(P)H-dependent flavin oxidoreductase YrpB (nitropropane dioxygenase family)
MWNDRRMLDLLGIEHPIIQAPMAGADSPLLAAAVSGAGGLGSLGCSSMSPRQLEESVAAFREHRNGARIRWQQRNQSQRDDGRAETPRPHAIPDLLHFPIRNCQFVSPEGVTSAAAGG